MKVLVATEKPFSKVAVDQIREIVEKGGHELATLERSARSSRKAATSLQLSRNIPMYSSSTQL